MGKITVRYLVARPRKAGAAYYWQPTKALLAAGFLPRRLSNDLSEAVRQAEALNAKLDAWYDRGGQPSGPLPGSLAALDALFQTDDEFRGLKPRTQSSYLYAIKPALAWAGDEQVADLTRKVLKIWYRDQRDRHGAANSRNAVAALRRLLAFGVSEDWIPDNPALKMKITTPASRERVWTLEERDRFVAHATQHGRPSMATAVMLGWCLGQRPADLRGLSWACYDGQSVELRQNKTGVALRVPALPELRTLLDALPRTAVQIVVSETTKRPYQESAFQHLFAELREGAGLPADLQFRDLRRTLATALGAAGCTDDQIRAITGHKTRNVVAVYVRPDDTFAKSAMTRLTEASAERNLNGSGLGSNIGVERKRSSPG
jgi:integrase